MEEFTLVVVGDGNVGKTCLIHRAVKQTFTDEYIVSVFDCYSALMTLDGANYNLTILDTGGQEEYRNHRLISYNSADIIVICFDLTNRDTLENVEQYINETRTHASGKPVVLVGTKDDLRSAAHVTDNPIKHCEGLTKMRENEMKAYFEVSSKMNTGILDMFHKLIRIYNKENEEEKSGWSCGLCSWRNKRR